MILLEDYLDFTLKINLGDQKIDVTMLDRKNEEVKNLEISLGLLAGYIVAGFLNMAIFDKPWTEAFSDLKLITGFGGIALSIVIFLWAKKRKNEIQPKE